MNKTTTGEKIFDIFLIGIMFIVGLVTLYPFLNVLALSLNDATDAVAGGIYLWPRKFTLHNYEEVFKYPSLIKAFINSVLRTVIGSALGVLFSAMIAYCISRRDFFARKFISYLFMITMYVSGGLIPTYLLMKSLGLRGNFLVYILPGLVWAFCVFVIRSFIDGLPISLQESAMIDGANDLVIFFRIIFPLTMPVIATVTLFYAVGHWNNWFDTYLYCQGKPNLTTLQYELQKIIRAANASQVTQTGDFSGEVMRLKNRVTPQAIQMAITILATLPILVVYPFLQRYFIKGMTLGAVKA